MQGPITWTYHAIKKQIQKNSDPAPTQTNTQVEGHNRSPPKPSSKQQPCPHPPANESTGKCEVCLAEKSAARRYRFKLLMLLFPGFFVSSLDLTVVATAMPFIASHFNAFNQLNWIVTAFTLTDTALIPIFGQLADIFGRYAALQLAICTLTIGSILCAAAPVWAVLLLGRALQGVGSAGMTNVSMIILADKVSLKEQAINTSIFQLLIGIGYSVGPVIGGYLTNANWRYTFVLCAGMSGISIVSFFFLRHDLKAGEISLLHPNSRRFNFKAFLSGCTTLDIGGAFLFIVGVGLLILGTSWGGSIYPWASAGVIAPVVVGVVLCAAFVAYEKLLEPGKMLNRAMPKTVPMVPFDLIMDKDITIVCILAAATGAAMYAAFYFIGIYFTLVEGYEAGKSGLQLLYYVPGLGFGAYAAMFMCNVSPAQTFWPLFVGTIVETAGMAALAYATQASHRTLVNVMMAIAGFGTGIRLMPESLHLAAMFRNRLAPTLSMLRFAMPFGGTMALTVMGAVFQNKMSGVFGDAAAQQGGVDGQKIDFHNTASLNALNQAPAEVQAIVRATGANAVMWAFVSIMPFIGLALIANLFLGNVWIKKGKPSDGDEVEKATQSGGTVTGQRTVVERDELPDVLNGCYLWALFTGSVKAAKHAGPAESEPYYRSADGKGSLETELIDRRPEGPR